MSCRPVNRPARPCRAKAPTTGDGSPSKPRRRHRTPAELAEFDGRVVAAGKALARGGQPPGAAAIARHLGLKLYEVVNALRRIGGPSPYSRRGPARPRRVAAPPPDFRRHRKGRPDRAPKWTAQDQANLDAWYAKWPPGLRWHLMGDVV